jgi:hypothetical protein
MTAKGCSRDRHDHTSHVEAAGLLLVDPEPEGRVRVPRHQAVPVVRPAIPAAGNASCNLASYIYSRCKTLTFAFVITHEQ